MPPLIGRRLVRRYRLESVIARGGMSTVYRAIDERLQRPVAVKILSAEYSADEEFVARFLAEARTAASVTHPNLAHVYDSGSDEELHFMVLELLEDHRSLRSEIRERGPLPPLEAGRVALDILAGLEPLHARGLLHCDVKTGNVMVGPAGAKLIDLGIARPLREAAAGKTSIGSLHAMSPEQLRGEPLSAASDIFAVGVVLFEALTGQVPYPGETAEAVAAAHRSAPVGSPSEMRAAVCEELEAVALQAIRYDPAGRFRSVPAMSVALTAALEAQRSFERGASTDTTQHRIPVPAAGDSPASRRRGSAALRIGSVAVAAATLLALGSVFLGSDDSQGNQPRSPTPVATPAVPAGMVRIPNTIGMSEAEAETVAREAGLAWRIEWRVVPGQAPGIHDQEPAPGTLVERGARFVMYAYRDR